MGTHKSTQTTTLFVVFGFGWILNNRTPGIDRIGKLLARFAPQANQLLPDFRVFQAVGTVDIPGEARTTRTAARLMVGQVRTGTRIVGLLGFPGDQTVFDIDFPAARTGTVNTVGRAHDFVVLPALAIAALPATIFIGGDPVTLGKGFPMRFEKAQLVEKMTHEKLLLMMPASLRSKRKIRLQQQYA